MRGLIQRVSEARVTIEAETVGAIGPGILVLVGIAAEDTEADAHWLAGKIAELRIFEDEAGKLNRSVSDIRGGVLVVSQFTLYGDTRKGRRPSFSRAARPQDAERLYLRCVDDLRRRDLEVATGRFGAHMRVALVNDGPVTLWLDSREG